MRSSRGYMVIFAALALLLCNSVESGAQTRVSIGVTETIETHNPYGDSVSLLYGIFSEVTGPFCTYNYAKGDFEGRLAERWKVENPTTWNFYLSKNYKFNDGTTVTAEDVVHSLINRVINDPQSKQKASVAPSVVKAEAVDKFTVKDHHRQTHGATSVISMRSADRDEQSRFRQVRPRRRRQRTYDGRWPVPTERADSRAALGAPQTARSS